MKSLELIGVTDTKKPNENNAPKHLSLEAKQVWNRVISDSYNQRLVASLDYESAWQLILDIVFESVTGDGNSMLSPSICSRTAHNTLAATITSCRAMMVQAFDKTKVFAGCKFSTVERTVDWSDGKLTIKSVAPVSLVDYDDPIDWLSNLTRKHRFIAYGRRYMLPGMITGVDVGFEVQLPSVSFVSTVTLRTEYVPERLVVPLPDYEAYQSFILNKMWLPAVRKFRYKSIQRKSMLL